MGYGFTRVIDAELNQSRDIRRIPAVAERNGAESTDYVIGSMWELSLP